MNGQKGQGDSSKGMRVNSRWLGTKDYPAWATPLQREKWTKQGLILWDSEARRVTRLSATQAIHVLDHLRTNDDWQTHGITVGEPATRLSKELSEREEEEISRALHEAYCILFGRENWELLGRFYQHDPEKAMEIVQEITSRSRGKSKGK